MARPHPHLLLLLLLPSLSHLCTSTLLIELRSKLIRPPFAFQVPETYAPAILRGRARKLADEVGAHHITAYEQGHKVGGWAAEAFKYLVTPFLFL